MHFSFKIPRIMTFGHRLRQKAIPLGSDYGGHAVCLTPLNERSIVYSCGVGTDISFEEQLIARTGATVHAFDPTPGSIAWLHAHRKLDRFIFHPWGIADFDGVAAFHPPEDPTHISHSIVVDSGSARPAIEVPVLRLQSTMERLGHDYLDVLKLDIEGAEYGVLRDVIDSGLWIGQIVVEFHHARPGLSESSTRAAIDDLQRAGFECTYSEPRGWEWSFMRPEPRHSL